MRTIAIALPAELLSDVDRAANDLGVSRSRYITQILRCAAAPHGLTVRAFPVSQFEQTWESVAWFD